MIRTRLAQSAAVAVVSLGALLLTPFVAQAATGATTPVSAVTASDKSLGWGGVSSDSLGWGG
ncbi:hypothetical protein ACFC1R_31970 [Kitasatospora sp. NPDC056138]|uniref:hypothetical protein n=1 Tax=Kitasatospora sp. NPDC056138 TaxID=3345724 RepID=UPI0035DDD3C2